MKQRSDSRSKLLGLAVAVAGMAWLGACSEQPTPGSPQKPGTHLTAQLLAPPQTNDVCMCVGTGPGGTPVTVECGLSTCGSDYTIYACSETGWAWTGLPCEGPDGGCQCTGTGPGGVPVTVDCGQSACGSDDYTYACSASGWAWTGQSCSGGTGGASGSGGNTGTTCQCTGTGPGGIPVTVDCGQSACGSDYIFYACSASGWAWTGESCSAGTGGSGTGGSGTGGSGTGGSGTGGSGTGGSGTGGSPEGVTVELDQTRQTMVGFGINDVWANAYTDAEADQLFNTTNGIGLSILRIAMGPNGNLMSSNMTSDIAKAKARGVSTIIGTVWSAPANCKTNGSVNDGGHLLPSCYDSWSTTMANFASTYELYAMSAQNEPDFASCGVAEPCNGSYPTMLYTPEEMVAFIKVLGPKLQAVGVKVLAPEPSQWLRNWTNGTACCSVPGGMSSTDPLVGQYDYGHALYADATAWSAIDIVGTHQYYSQAAQPWPGDVPQTKPVWMTDMSGIKWWPEQGPSTDIINGVAVAGWIHDALVNGMASAWLWWWYKAYAGTNEGLLLVDGTDTKRHYTLGNYSKFIRPGYTRVDITGDIPTDVLLSAYQGADGTVVIVAINQGNATAAVPITIAGGTAPASLTPWVTSTADNLAAKATVPVSGGSFTANLAAKTVTTYVGP